MAQSRHVLTTPEAARFLGLAERTLEDYRVRGCGPRYLKLGAAPRSPVRYRAADLEAYLEAAERSSTTDAGPSAA